MWALFAVSFFIAPTNHPNRAIAPRMAGGGGRGAAGTAAGGGGDISGGGDEERNAQLSALRKMFVTASPQDVPAEEAVSDSTEDGQPPGLLRDMPLCRYSWCIMPGHQVAMSVWQPQCEHAIAVRARHDAAMPLTRVTLDSRTCGRHAHV